ncbi:MAG TPA: sigma 54-interacting transcriptional regulator [Polyangiaceae bacterium]|jgi:transcriptional regulator with GAF, ATPase, and Fis domain
MASAPVRSRALKLVVVSQGGFVGYALPSRGTVVLGRSEKSDLKIDDPSITRRHAVLHLGDRIEIEDLGSVNGTRVRDQRIEPGLRVPVFRGEAFRLGAALLVIHAIHAAEDAAPESGPISEEIATRRDDGTATGHAPASRARAHIVEDPAMHALYDLVDRIAAGNINVLVVGETGAGKELVAERVHERSRRRGRPFLRLNCAAVAESLLEAELFGYERGAFTGASQAKPGLLEVVDGGTLFLDEVGEMPLSLQAKMLRALESQQVLRVGGLAPRTIDVRFVAATNRDLDEQVRLGRFREDLFFRLNGALVAVPPLRERPAEIEPLAREFIRAACAELGRKPVPALRPEALLMLQGYAWPGNVRELKNFVDRAVLVAPGAEISPEHLPIQRMAATLPLHRIGSTSIPPPPGAPQTGRATPLPTLPPPSSGDPERDRILAVLAECGGNQSRAARALGISRTTLVSRLDDYGIPRPRKP